jgi:HK97 family phage portal protein
LKNPFRALAKWISGGHPASETPGVLWSRGYMTESGQPMSETAAMNISAVYAAVKLLSETVACLPLNVIRMSGDNREQATLHPVWKLLHLRPNPEMTPKTFWQLMQTYKLLWGNAYAEIQWTGGSNAAALWPLEPWRVQAKRDDSGKLYFLVDSERRIEDEDLLRMPHMSEDGIVGKSVVSYARESLGLTQAANLYGASFFGSGGIPSGVLEHPGKINPASAENIRKEWNEAHSPVSGGKSQRTAVLYEGMKYNKIGIPPEDSQFLETRLFQVAEIARWFGIPPHMLHDLSRSTYSNIEHQQIEFVMYSLTPHLVEWEQELGRKLLDPPKLYAKFNVRGLMRGDMAAQAAFFKEMNFIGVYHVNEIKDLLDENGVGAEGDIRVIQSAMIPLKDVGKKPEPPVVPPAPEEPPADDSPEDESEGSDEESPMQAVREAAELMLQETVARMLRKETTAARSASKNHNRFMAWMDEFYPKFQSLLSEAMTGPLSVMLRIGGTSDGGLSASNLASEYAAEHVQKSRHELLTAMEVKPDQFSQSVDRYCTHWEKERTKLESIQEIITCNG